MPPPETKHESPTTIRKLLQFGHSRGISLPVAWAARMLPADTTYCVVTVIDDCTLRIKPLQHHRKPARRQADPDRLDRS